MTRKRTAALLVVSFSLFALLLLSSAPLAAQLRSRDLAGTVTDHDREPLKGAIVQIENGATLGVVSYLTQSDGAYRFQRLQGNTDYRVWVTFRGRRSSVRKLSQFDTNQPKTINFRLNLH